MPDIWCNKYFHSMFRDVLHPMATQLFFLRGFTQWNLQPWRLTWLFVSPFQQLCLRLSQLGFRLRLRRPYGFIAARISIYKLAAIP
jgi:hypothetical protein